MLARVNTDTPKDRDKPSPPSVARTLADYCDTFIRANLRCLRITRPPDVVRSSLPLASRSNTPPTYEVHPTAKLRLRQPMDTAMPEGWEITPLLTGKRVLCLLRKPKVRINNSPCETRSNRRKLEVRRHSSCANSTDTPIDRSVAIPPPSEPLLQLMLPPDNRGNDQWRGIASQLVNQSVNQPATHLTTRPTVQPAAPCMRPTMPKVLTKIPEWSSLQPKDGSLGSISRRLLESDIYGALAALAGGVFCIMPHIRPSMLKVMGTEPHRPRPQSKDRSLGSVWWKRKRKKLVETNISQGNKYRMDHNRTQGSTGPACLSCGHILVPGGF